MNLVLCKRICLALKKKRLFLSSKSRDFGYGPALVASENQGFPLSSFLSLPKKERETSHGNCSNLFKTSIGDSC
jgi:hypothetical protein